MTQQLDYAPWGVAQHRVMTALAEIISDSWLEQRSTRRLAYFGPVTLTLPCPYGLTISAFVRDVSPGGIGLVHLTPLTQGELLVALSLPSGRAVSMRTEILWCRAYPHGWYASGGRFIDVVQ